MVTAPPLAGLTGEDESPFRPQNSILPERVPDPWINSRVPAEPWLQQKVVTLALSVRPEAPTQTAVLVPEGCPPPTISKALPGYPGGAPVGLGLLRPGGHRRRCTWETEAVQWEEGKDGGGFLDRAAGHPRPCFLIRAFPAAPTRVPPHFPTDAGESAPKPAREWHRKCWRGAPGELADSTTRASQQLVRFGRCCL